LQASIREPIKEDLELVKDMSELMRLNKDMDIEINSLKNEHKRYVKIAQDREEEIEIWKARLEQRESFFMRQIDELKREQEKMTGYMSDRSKLLELEERLSFYINQNDILGVKISELVKEIESLRTANWEMENRVKSREVLKLKIFSSKVNSINYSRLKLRRKRSKIRT
jgi:hypothetical protein